MDRVWVGHCFKNLDPDEVGQDAGPQGVAFPDSVLGSLGLARLGDVTEMVQTFTWPMPHIFLKEIFSQIRSVAQSCPTPCDPMNRSTPGLPVHHHLPEFTQTHIHLLKCYTSMKELLMKKKESCPVELLCTQLCKNSYEKELVPSKGSLADGKQVQDGYKFLPRA